MAAPPQRQRPHSHTSEKQIPGSYFFQAGEVKYLFTDASSTIYIVMDGYASSTFSLDVEELVGDILMASTTWKDMPVTPDTLVSLTTFSDITTLSPLTIDKNSDGIVDYTIASKLNGTSIFDTTPPEARISFSTSTQTLLIEGIDETSQTTVFTTATSSTITDEAGNTLKIIFKLQQEKREIKLEILDLLYNGVSGGKIAKNTLQYEYSLDKSGNIKELEEKAAVGTMKIGAHYDAKKNVTRFQIESSEHEKKDSLQGLVIINVQMRNGNLLVVNY